MGSRVGGGGRVVLWFGLRKVGREDTFTGFSVRVFLRWTPQCLARPLRLVS
jgi:hypothetical protein